MTVRILTDVQKHLIAHQYSFIKLSIKDLAQDHKVSTRTIQRVLIEKGVHQIRKRKSVPVLSNEAALLHSTDKPGVIGTIKGFFKSIFGSRKQTSDVQATK